MIPLIRCGFGIGNRVTMIANALSRNESIQFVWRVNPILPLEHWEVFPNGINGVEFVDSSLKGFSTRWERKVPGESWEGAGDREKANTAYSTIIEAMAGKEREGIDLAIVARFWRFPEADPVELAELASRYGSQAFILADSRREEIATELNKRGMAAILPNGGEMSCDLDRSPESTLAYLSDWKTAIMAETVITHQADTSVIHPAKARGARIIRSSI
jgi:hypothetical protein